MATQNLTDSSELDSRAWPARSSSAFEAASDQIASISPIGYIQTTIYDIANRVIGNQNALSQIYTRVLDNANRSIASVNPLGFRSSVVWDQASQQIASIDALGNYATNVWAANGQLIASQNELSYLTSFILDAASQRICVVDANIGRSTTLFSNRGYVAATQDQLGKLTSFTQDANGNNILRVDARNWPTTYTVDALNRTAKTLYVDGTRVTNTWDAASQQITSSDVTGLTSFVWDLDSRKTSTVNPTGIALTNTLDPLGNRLVMADPYGRTTYSWDQQSRLLSIWNPLNERTSLTWDPLDREQHRVLGNGGTISHTWDAVGRETLIENRDKNGVGQAVFTNTYSPVDNRLTVLELDGTRATFSYDASSQIVSEARGGTMAYARSYTWDPLGNSLKQYDNGVLTTSTFNAANQQTLITPANGAPTTQLFDANGNQTVATTGSAVTTQTWSPENKLVGLVSPTLNETYLCSDDGLRKSQTTAAGTTLFTYDDVLVLLETTPGGVLQARNTDYPGQFGGLASQNRSGTSNFYGYDSQESTRILVSISGVITDSYSYKVFGEPLQTGSGTVNPHNYVGLVRYRQQTNGFYLLGVRVLDPFTGQFTSVDPIGFDGGDWNPYRYVNNDPTAFADPLGLFPEKSGTYLPPADPTTTVAGRCAGMSPGACYACAYPTVTCEAANTLCGSHVRCGPGAPVMPSPPYGWVDCMANCIKQHDPLSTSQKLALTAAGGTVPKSWCKALGIIPKYPKSSGPLTTIPSIIHLKLGIGGRSPLRRFGRFWSPIWIAYGDYLGVVEVGCATACLRNVHAY